MDHTNEAQGNYNNSINYHRTRKEVDGWKKSGEGARNTTITKNLPTHKTEIQLPFVG